MPPAANRPDLRPVPLWPRATALPAAGRPECNTTNPPTSTPRDGTGCGPTGAAPTELASAIRLGPPARADAPSPAPRHVLPAPASPIRLRRGVEITARDVALLRDLVLFYGLTRKQLHARHFGAERTAANRLAALACGGYVRMRRAWYAGPAVYVATELGARVAGLGIPAPRWSRLSIGHHITVADVSLALLAASRGASWVAERELRSAAMAAVRGRGGRLIAGAEHVPDGLLVSASRAASAPRTRLPSAAGGAGEGIAVEVELKTKSRAEYRRILGWYGAKLAYRRVAWYCATDAVRRRLDELVRAERAGDFMTVEPLPDGVTVPSWD